MGRPEDDQPNGAAAVTLGSWSGSHWLRPAADPIAASGPIPVVEQDDPGPGVNLLHYWSLVVKFRWLLLTAAVLGLAAGAAATMLTTPIYRATATVQIDTEPAKITAVQSQRETDAWTSSDTFYPTQYELLKSRALAQRVVANENLATDAKFMNQWAKKGQETTPKAASAKDRAALTDRAVGLISSRLQIEPVRLSRVVRITYESPDPQIASRIANAVASNYITWNLERRYNASAEARRFLETRLEQTRENLEDSQRRGNDYAQRNQLITIEGAAAVGPDGKSDSLVSTGESLVAADLASVNQQLAAATAARIQAEQRWRQASSTSDLALPEIISNPTFQTLKASRDSAWSEYQQNLRVYKPDWPAMVDARKKVEALDNQIAVQASALRSALQTELEVARRNEGQFQAEVNKRKGELLASQSKRVEQSFINTDINTSRSLYDAMLSSYKEIGIAAGVADNNISFVDKALTPGHAFQPNPRRNLIQFGLLGVALGALVAFLLDRFDLTMKVPVDLEQELRLALLGTVPVSPKDLSVRKGLDDPKSILSEAYYSVRSALQFSTEDGAPASLLVTSTRPGEGKSTSSLAIASGFARLGLRVLLVDGDMRDPSLHRVLSRDNGVGLSNLLASGSEMSPAFQPTSYANLTFLAAGPPPPNPAELLAGRKLRAFLAFAREHFDMVVVDGPPVMGLADAPQIAGVTAGTVMIVEAGRTNREVTRAAIRRLRMSNARILGGILTKFDLKKAGYSYGHANGYGYGYGYGYGLEYGTKPRPKAQGLLAFAPWLGAARRKA